MKPNSIIIDENGRRAKLITMPVPGRSPAMGVVLYEDDRGELVDLAQWRPAGEEETDEQPG